VYGPETTQEHLFNEEVRPMLKRILQGQNASVLAYGPTGAGMLC
jgi:kinesin family protein 22